jgi:signal recognition particle receptor subunit beta
MTHKSLPQTRWIGVTGHFASGKTAFIRSISDVPVKNVDLDVGHARIAFDYGRIAVDEDYSLNLYGNAGAYPPHAVLRISEPGLLGVVVMVDTAKPEQFRSASSIIATLTSLRPLPFIVAANPYEYNKSPPNINQMTLPANGLNLEAVRTVLHVPDDIPIVPCVAVDYKSVARVLVALTEKELEAEVQQRLHNRLLEKS